MPSVVQTRSWRGRLEPLLPGSEQTILWTSRQGQGSRGFSEQGGWYAKQCVGMFSLPETGSGSFARSPGDAQACGAVGGFRQ
eukprot:9559630-Alexandrium_andersonii.AAC.1